MTPRPFLPFAARALKTLTLCCLFCACSHSFAQSVRLPQASPLAKISQVIGITEVSVEYSRPSVNGRAIWGALVPYGFSDLGWANASAAPWRAGANRNTVLSFEHEVLLEGQPVPAGQYGLHLALQPSGDATVILSRNSTSWGSYFYDPDEDVLRIAITPEEAEHQEQLSYSFSDVSKYGGTLLLRWERKSFPISIAVATDKHVLASLKKQLRDAHGFHYQNFVDAANYLLANDLELELALEWAEIAIERPFVGRRNRETLELKARVLERLGRAEQARSTRDELAALDS